MGLFLPPTHPDLRNGKLSTLLAVLLGTFMWRMLWPPAATHVQLRIICARIAGGAVLTELNAYPGRLNVGSLAIPDRPNVMISAVQQDTLALPKVSPV